MKQVLNHFRSDDPDEWRRAGVEDDPKAYPGVLPGFPFLPEAWTHRLPHGVRRSAGRVAVLLTRPWVQHVVSLCVSALALALTFLMDSWLPQTPTPLLFAAVILTSAYGGLGPGLLSTLVCAIGLDIILEEPRGVAGAGGSSIVHLGVFVLVAVLTSMLTERMRTAELQAKADATRMAILADVSRALTTVVPDHQQTLQGVARKIGRELGDACVISLLTEDGLRLTQAASYHRSADAQEALKTISERQLIGVFEGLTGRILRNGRPVVMSTSDPSTIRDAAHPAFAAFLNQFPIYSIVSIPLTVRSRSFGTLTVWRNSPQSFTWADQQLLEELANRSALAIDSARLSIYYQALFQQVPEPTLVMDAGYHLLDANPAASTLLGKALLDLRGRQVDRLLGKDRGGLASLLAELQESGRWSGELELGCLDGGSVSVDASAVTVELLTGPVYIWVLHDLTQQRNLQQMRSDFVASASHELRTPLTAAFAALGLMQQPGSGHLDPAHRHLLDNAMRNILRLRVLVDDLLAEGQLQAQMLNLSREPIDLRDVITDAVEAVRPLVQRKEQTIALNLSEALPVDGDALRLEQVFINLLANANLHTPKKSNIEIVGRVDDRSLHVCVCDDGPGIPAEHIEGIFERFSQINSAGKGSGLGLNIAHDLVKMHAGTLVAEKDRAVGAAFHVTLPVSSDRG